MFVHCVYFWVKPNTPAAAVNQMISDCQMLTKIPTVRHIWAGKPAMTAESIVDNSYAVGLTVVFDDLAGHDVYQDHEIHSQYIARNQTHWSRVQVYDFR